MKDIEIPIFSSDFILKITELVKKAYELKSKRKCILKETDNLLNSYFLK
ncbi:hypothetical protein [Spiroplasma citri]|nr:hypothetical protein [Spiroplasma citri]QIA66944.1 hypothetical protein GMI18_04335 [Spiroplasma citri]QIA70630.1 hypothetical protein GL981_04145 [Spiroplasma citri]QIA74899.1 hypothetical protein GTU57_03920 [Spiroplasma citri]QJU61592.1 hypothetical protein HHA36_03840 [Spiroplasma citri]WFG99159.1 hypothetical protein M1770_04170 [Spiroplasma citri]